MQRLDISVVIPVYSGERYLSGLVAQLLSLQAQWNDENSLLKLLEVILVNDDAIDNSGQLIDKLAADNEVVRALHLSRNFGQHPATIAGILHASGHWVVTLDEDFQHHPMRIGNMLRVVADTGCDIVYAKPIEAVHESAFRDWSSRAYKKALTIITGNPCIVDFNSFRLLRGDIARAAASVSSHDTFYDVALSWFTTRAETLSMELKDQRVISGRGSGYTPRKLLSHARRLLISAQTKWVRAGGIVGFGAMSLSMVFALFIVIQKLVAPDAILVQGWASQFTATLFFGGLISLLLGFVLEYLSVMLLQSQGRPLFFVADRSSDALLRQHFKR